MDGTGLTSEMSFDIPDMRGLSSGSHAAPVHESAWARIGDRCYSWISQDPCSSTGTSGPDDSQ